MSRARYWVYALHRPRWILRRPEPELPEIWELTVSDEHGIVESTVRTTRRGLIVLAGYLGTELARTEEEAPT